MLIYYTRLVYFNAMFQIECSKALAGRDVVASVAGDMGESSRHTTARHGSGNRFSTLAKLWAQRPGNVWIRQQTAVPNDDSKIQIL